MRNWRLLFYIACIVLSTVALNIVLLRLRVSQTFVIQVTEMVIVLVSCTGILIHGFRQAAANRKLSAQLMDAEKRMLEAAIMKNNFMANMSHEIRTPLNAITGFTQLLNQRITDSKSAEFLKCIGDAGEIMVGIINDILDFSRIEAGMLRIQTKPFRVRELMQSVHTMFNEKVQQKNIRFTLTIDSAVPEIVEGDPARLTQIMINLVNNAVKFTGTGAIEINVAAAGRENDCTDISFSIRDTGIGIPANKMHTIFERFQQVDDDITSKYGGSGLGLCIVRELVELQHGSINASSVQHEGTEVSFTIPYKAGTLHAQRKQGKAPDLGPITVGARPAHVMIVEDNEMNQRLIRHLLTEWKVEITLAGHGADALALLREKSFDLILMDLQMPEMDGYTAAKKIRKEMKSAVPIIAMTAHTRRGETGRCLANGMDGYIEKPVRARELHSLIRNSIRKRMLHPRKYVMPDARPKMLNLDYLHELSGGNDLFEMSMIRQFLMSIPPPLELMQQEYENGDMDKIRHIAHNLKTSVSFMGLGNKLDAHLSYLEEKTDSGTQDPVLQEKICTVRSICEQAMQEASEYLTGTLTAQELRR